MRRIVAALLVLGLALAAGGGTPAAQEKVRKTHAVSLFGGEKYGPDFKHFDYVNPEAPKGGAVRQFAIGSFDSLNQFILKGRPGAAAGVFETLMTSSLDEASTEYGLIAESVEIPDDLSWVIFNLRPEARWHDGTALTADDVVFSFEMLKSKGHPFYRQYYANVARSEKLGDHRVRFSFDGKPNRELPQIIGQLPIFSKAYYSKVSFEETSLEPPLGSGPYRIRTIEPGRSIMLERVKDYWGKDLPVMRGLNNFDVIRIDYYRDQTVALEAFKAHEYDFRSENSARLWATGYQFPALERGVVKKGNIRNENPTGMQAFAFNIRRKQFQDRRVREALGHAFDFEWSNKNLFFGQYTRTTSYFSNSELAAVGLPTPGELEYLQPFMAQLPAEVLAKEFKVPVTDGSGNNREGLRIAANLLKQAGWEIKNKVLTNSKTGKPMEFEVLLSQPDFERIVLPIVQNWERLGVKVRVRTVDTSQYQNREDEFDFDVIVNTFPQSLSPGNEQRDFWSSAVADVKGSRNVVGIKNPVVDALIERVIEAPDRPHLISATRALDRVLLWEHYVVPQFHVRAYRVAYWDKFGRPKVAPKYGLAFNSWWVDSALDASLEQRKQTLRPGR
ncbi:MAG: ABC transporter substrate-binding protein [Alphaproteobacteria bacterium]|nr:ABC transporter substrate-binding protein [Alphaproteobacteria bacterium]